MSSSPAERKFQAKDVTVHKGLDQKQPGDGSYVSQRHAPAGDLTDVLGRADLREKSVVEDQPPLEAIVGRSEQYQSHQDL